MNYIKDTSKLTGASEATRSEMMNQRPSRLSWMSDEVADFEASCLILIGLSAILCPPQPT